MLCALISPLMLALPPAVESSAWKYVVPAPREPFAHPPLRALPLTDQRPADLEEKVTYRGKRQRYAQLRYGSPASIRVAIVVDELPSGEVDLYVDARRKRTIESADKVSGDKLTWRLNLDVAILEGEATKGVPRTVVFRYGRVSRTLSYATCGYVEGQADLGGARVTVRRVDGDGNGFLTDPQDRLWLDLDGSGRWDRLEHQFAFAPLLTIRGRRFVVQSDPLGTRLAFAPLEGTGTVRLAVPTLPGGDVEDVSVTLVSRDGIVATLRANRAEEVLPVGEYRCSQLLLTLKDSKSGQVWGYLFSDNGGEGERWHELAKGGTLVVDPVGRVKLTCPASHTGKCVAGEQVQLRPGLYTGEGLLVTSVYLGRERPIISAGTAGPHAKIVLAGPDGGKQDEASSGFA